MFGFSKKLIIGVILGAVVLCGMLFVAWNVYVPVQSSNTTIHEITVEQGQGLSSIATTLKDAGLIRSRSLFILYVRDL